MRLIVEYCITDGCTYSFYQIVPVVYDSTEAFLVDFEEQCLEKRLTYIDVELGGQTFDANHFFENDIFIEPNIYTVDEWFKDLEK